MSDDGYGARGDDFVAIVRTAIDDRGMTWEQLSALTGMSIGEIQRVLSDGTYGFQRNLTSIYRIAVALDIDPALLVANHHASPKREKQPLFKRIREVVYQYIVMRGLPSSVAEEIIEDIRNRMKRIPTSNLQAAFRSGTLPNTWKDVARIHRQLGAL